MCVPMNYYNKMLRVGSALCHSRVSSSSRVNRSSMYGSTVNGSSVNGSSASRSSSSVMLRVTV